MADEPASAGTFHVEASQMSSIVLSSLLSGSRKLAAAVAFGVATSAAPTFAAVYPYLFIEGIAGPSTSKPGAIDIFSFSVGVSAPEAGKVQKSVCSNLTVMKALDKTSPLLLQAVLTGRPFTTAVLVYDRTSGDKLQTYFTLTLENAVLTSVQDSGSNENPTESVSLKSNSMIAKYWPEKGDGTLGDPIVTKLTCP